MGDPHLVAATLACQSWGLGGATIGELNRSENVVYRVELDGGEAQVLRLHRPGYNTRAQLESEVLWVRSLAQSGLPVPDALPAAHGPHYVVVDVDGVPHEAGMVSWVPGAPLRQHQPRPLHHYRTLGALAARIRAHGESWSPPPGFDRRRWDADGFVGDQPLWGRFWEADDLASDQRAILRDARTALREELGALSVKPDRFGLIHADLHAGNVMVDGDAVTMIDFDDSGFGWYSFELAVVLCELVGEPDYDEARRLLLDGYRSVHPLEPDEEAAIETMLLVRQCMIIGWADHRKDIDGYREFFSEAATAATAAAAKWLAARAH